MIQIAHEPMTNFYKNDHNNKNLYHAPTRNVTTFKKQLYQIYYNMSYDLVWSTLPLSRKYSSQSLKQGGWLTNLMEYNLYFLKVFQTILVQNKEIWQAANGRKCFSLDSSLAWKHMQLYEIYFNLMITARILSDLPFSFIGNIIAYVMRSYCH